MKLLSDYKGEEALDILADIIEPLSLILASEGVQEVYAKQKAGKKVAPVEFIKPALKENKDEVLAILARIEGVPVEDYRKNVNFMTLPLQILSVINDPNIKSLFTSQSQTSSTSTASSGSAIVNTEAGKN